MQERQIVQHLDANDIMHQLKIAYKERKPRLNRLRGVQRSNNQDSTDDEM